jgi:hypothetical protein
MSLAYLPAPARFRRLWFGLPPVSLVLLMLARLDVARLLGSSSAPQLNVSALPLSFEANEGQMRPEAAFRSGLREPSSTSRFPASRRGCPRDGGRPSRLG